MFNIPRENRVSLCIMSSMPPRGGDLEGTKVYEEDQLRSSGYGPHRRPANPAHARASATKTVTADSSHTEQDDTVARGSLGARRDEKLRAPAPRDGRPIGSSRKSHRRSKPISQKVPGCSHAPANHCPRLGLLFDETEVSATAGKATSARPPETAKIVTRAQGSRGRCARCWRRDPK